MSSPQTYGGKKGVNKVTITKFESRIAQVFRKGVMGQSIRILENLPGDLPPENTASPIPIPDGVITSTYFADNCIDSTTLAKNIKLPRNTYKVRSDTSSNSLATVQYVNTSLEGIYQNLEIEETLTEVLNTFSNDITDLSNKFPAIDSSLSAIENTSWIVRDKFANQSITGNKLDSSLILPSTITVSTSNSTGDNYIANTSYLRTQYTNFKADASISTVGNLARSINNMTDASFHAFANTKIDKTRFDTSYNSMMEKTPQRDTSLNLLNTQISLNQSKLNNQIVYFDASLANLYKKTDASSSYFSTQQHVDSSNGNTISTFNSRETSYYHLKTHIDSSLSVVYTDNWVGNTHFQAGLNIPITATLPIAPTDASSLHVVSTNYVKTEFSKITGSSLNSLEDLATIIAEDASFAYSVVRKINHLDISNNDASNAILSLELRGKNATNGKTSTMEIERIQQLQYDSSVNLFSVAQFVTTTDACLNSIHNKQIHYDASFRGFLNKTLELDSISTQVGDAIDLLKTGKTRHDTSYSLLDSILTTQHAKLSTIDVSLHSFLDNRENNVETGFQTNYASKKERWYVADMSFSLLKQKTDSSLNDSSFSLYNSDLSVNTLTSFLRDISTNTIPTSATIIDGSFVSSHLRETYHTIELSLNILGIHADQSINVLEHHLQNTETRVGVIDSSLSIEITNRVEALQEEYISLDASANHVMNTLASNMTSRETTWENAISTIDTSFNTLIVDYSATYLDVVDRKSQLASLDASMTTTYELQTAMAETIDNSMNVFSENTIDSMHDIEIALADSDQIVNAFDFTSMDASLNLSIEKTQLHDVSLAIIESERWVETDRLSNVIQLPTNTVINVAGDLSGNQISTTHFFQTKIGEAIGSTILPFDSLTSFAQIINSSSDFGIVINNILDSVSLNLTSIHTAINDISVNTVGNLDYDASMNYISGKLDGLDTSFNMAENGIYDYISNIDNRVEEVMGSIQNTDSSFNLLEMRDMNSLVVREIAHQQTVESMKIAFDSSLTALNVMVGNTGQNLDTLAADVSSNRDIVLELIDSFDGRFQVTDASYHPLLETYGGIENRGFGLNIDASLSSISTNITTVSNGVHTYLNDSIVSSSYQSSFSSLNQKTTHQDASLSTLETKRDISYNDIISHGDMIQGNAENILSSYNATDASRVDIVFVTAENNTHISTIDSSGWVTTMRLDENLVLPSDVRVPLENTDIATLAGVKTAIDDIVSFAPVALNTLDEIVAALNADVDLVGTIQGLVDSADTSLNMITAFDGTIATQTDDYANRIIEIEGLPYGSLDANMTTLYNRMEINDVSTNSVAATAIDVNTKVENALSRILVNDASTNFVDGIISLGENAGGVIDTSIGNVEIINIAVDPSYTSLETIAGNADTGLTTNDASTNIVYSAVISSDISSNMAIRLFGSPSNFGVTGTTSSSITCSYVEPVLKDAMGIDNYRITATPIYGDTSVIVNDLSPGTNQLTMSGLVSGAVYDISLAARNIYDTVVISGVSGATVIAAPTGLVGSSSTTSGFTATWNGVTGAISKYAYSAEYGVTTLSSGDVTSSTTTYDFTGLPDGTSYIVRVRAGNPYTQSADVSMVYGTIFDAPSGFALDSRTTTGLEFTVDTITKPYSLVNVSYSPLGGPVTTTTTATPPITLTSLSSGKIYDVSINIQNEYGDGVWTNAIRNSTGIVVPSLTVGSITTSGMTVSFSSALATQDCSYALRTIPATTTYVLNSGNTSQIITGLAEATAYSVVLDASNTYTNSSANVSSGTIFNAPSALTFVSRSLTDLSFTVTGTTKPFTQYNISYLPLGVSSALVATDTSSNIRLRSLTSGKIYDVSVNIQNAYGVSAWSSVVRNSTALGLPASITASNINHNSMKINFSSALGVQDCSYTIRTVPASVVTNSFAGDTSASIVGLTATTAYTIYLEASNNIAPTVSVTTTATTTSQPLTIQLASPNGVVENIGTVAGRRLYSFTSTSGINSIDIAGVTSPLDMKILLVGGGGGGGGGVFSGFGSITNSGGGGGGGVTQLEYTLTGNTKATFTIGAGGNNSVASDSTSDSNNTATNGGNTRCVFTGSRTDTITVAGGGRGGGNNGDADMVYGVTISGGGGGGKNGSPGVGASSGLRGGDGLAGSNGGGGGGGGAGGNGGNGQSGTEGVGGNGGNGVIPSTSFPQIAYGGGGGGGGGQAGGTANGGGGGGNGGSGTDGRGGGGGGAAGRGGKNGRTPVSGRGGSGIAIVSIPSSVTVVYI